jgi:AraC-like DNA-binding protein
VGFWPLADLASIVGVSPVHLVRTFSRSIGLPPRRYQSQLRLARARRLLSAHRSISWVAHECGFADQSHLARRFKQLYCLTPSEFQAQQRAAIDSDAA